MIKGIILGALLVVALVGYGVLTPETLEDAGAEVKSTVNAGAAWVKSQTDPTALDQARELLK